jgi:hypothetical protein
MRPHRHSIESQEMNKPQLIVFGGIALSAIFGIACLRGSHPQSVVAYTTGTSSTNQFTGGGAYRFGREWGKETASKIKAEYPDRPESLAVVMSVAWEIARGQAAPDLGPGEEEHFVQGFIVGVRDTGMDLY